MPLTFDWSNTALETNDQNDLNLADCAVWATMAVGINHVTEANAREFYARVSFWEKVVGPYRFHIDPETNQKVDDYFSVDDVMRLIGLRTNSTPKTKAQFYKAVWETHDSFNVPRNFVESLTGPRR